MKKLVPESFDPQVAVQAEEFNLRRLEPKYAEMDQKAIMESIPLIRRLRGGTWPEDIGLTVEEDCEEMAIHLQEFNNKTSFAYIILNTNEDEGLGCVYFYPPNHPFNWAAGRDNTNADVIINLWVSQAAYDRGLYPKVWKFIEEWVAADWPFERPFYSNPVKPEA